MMSGPPNLPIPTNPKTASDFIAEIQGFKREDREAKFFEYLTTGHVPSWTRNFIDFTMTFVDARGTAHTLELQTFSDYLAIGTDDDSMTVPLWPLTAQQLCGKWDCNMITTKMVTMFWHAAAGKVPPQPWGPPYDASMMSTARIDAHNKRVAATMARLNIDRTRLCGGHKKDVVITNQLQWKPKHVAIFGWHRANGRPIQPLYLGHINRYGDYSHGIRLVAGDCTLDGNPDRVTRIMQDPELHVALSNEGPMVIVGQPDP